MAHKQIRITSSLDGKTADVSINDLNDLTNVEMARLYDLVQICVRDRFDLTRLESTAIAEIAGTLNKQK